MYRNMALISIPAPKCLSSIQVPGVKEDPEYLHVTLCYLGDNVSSDIILKAYYVVADICSTFNTFIIKSDYTTMFSNNGKGFPIICAIESPMLYDLREKIAAGLTKAKVPFANNFVPFKPHCTLSFSPIAAVSQTVGISWAVTHINIWPQDKGNIGEIQIRLNNKSLLDTSYSV